MEPTGSNTVFHVSDIERSIVGNEWGHSGFPESAGSHVVSGNAECLRFVGASHQYACRTSFFACTFPGRFAQDAE
jgi:hypothetical protein